MRTDEELALGMKQGNTGDLALLVERHHSALIGYLFRMTGGDRRLAEDLVQETFVRVIRSVERYHYPRPFKPWLYAIATNLTRDHFKSADVRRAAAPVDDDLSAAASQMPHPEQGLIEDDAAREVVAALEGLPEHQREVVILRYYQELSLAEIAAVLDIPLGTVKSRLSIGLNRLRELMEQEDYA